MANVARDDLYVIRIPRKVILGEPVKKIGGREPTYELWYDNGKYQCIARTVIATSEPRTSGKLEEAIGMLANTTQEAEEEAASALVQHLKKVYRLEIDDMNFIPRTNNERLKERLEEDMHGMRYALDCEINKTKKLVKGWTKSIDDLSFVQELCEEVCGNGLVNLPIDYLAGSGTELIHDIYCLADWTEGKVYESTSNLEDTMKSK